MTDLFPDEILSLSLSRTPFRPRPPVMGAILDSSALASDQCVSQADKWEDIVYADDDLVRHSYPLSLVFRTVRESNRRIFHVCASRKNNRTGNHDHQFGTDGSDPASGLDAKLGDCDVGQDVRVRH